MEIIRSKKQKESKLKKCEQKPKQPVCDTPSQIPMC